MEGGKGATVISRLKGLALMNAVGAFFMVKNPNLGKEMRMYTVDVERMVETAKKKVEYFQLNPLGYLLLSAMAGIYLGFGICLIFSVGAPFWLDG